MSWLWGWKVLFICEMLVVTRLPSCVIWGFVIVFVQLVGLNVELTLLLELTMAKFRFGYRIFFLERLFLLNY